MRTSRLPLRTVRALECVTWAVAGALFILGLVVAVLWACAQPLWFLNSHTYEPTLVFLTSLCTLAVLVGPLLSSYRRSRERQLSAPGSPVREFPTLWMPTNHSKSTIDCVPVRRGQDERHEVDAAIAECYPNCIRGPYRVSRVDETSGTLNYRVQGRGKAVLLRIHNRISSEFALTNLQRVQRHLFESGVFEDSPHAECLVPLQSRLGRDYEVFRGRLVEAYPFADNVEHYAGRTLAQVKELALRYGAVQKALQGLDSSLDLTVINSTRPWVSWFQEERDLFDTVYSLSDRISKRLEPDRFARLFHQHRQLLSEVWNEVMDRLVSAESSATPLLHDFHPHNTFFRDDKCVLIYDYETVSRHWSETEALAFAVHRFTREYVRLLGSRHHPAPEAEIPRVVHVFLENYEQGGMPVPSDFAMRLSTAVKTTNLGKLLSIMTYHYRIRADPAERCDDMWFSELVKFITYLLEADRYALA